MEGVPPRGSAMSQQLGLEWSPGRPHILAHFELERVDLETRNVLFLMIRAEDDRNISRSGRILSKERKVGMSAFPV